MDRNLLSVQPAGIGAGLEIAGPGTWGMLGSDILASSATGEHGPGLAANDGLTPGLRYVYLLDTRSAPSVILYPDSSHEGPVPYSGTVRLYEQGTGDVGGTLAQRSFSVSAASTATAPTISAQPQPQAVAPGAVAGFTVSASGTAPLSYQWRRNGVDLVGATTASYVILSAQLSDSGALFSVTVSNAAGSITSTAAALTVQASAVAPQIAQQPQPQSVPDQAQAAFSVAATGTAPLAYQWRRDGANIAGATSASYTVLSAQQVDSGALFSVLVSNSAGSAVSAGAVLTVQAPVILAPTIISQPVTAAWDAGSTAVVTVAAAGSLPMSYQWTRNGVAIPGATGPTLSIANVDLADSRAALQVTVTNVHGQATSRRAELLVPIVSMQAAKTGARIDDDRFDADIPRWIDAAVRLAEQFCNRFFTPKAPRFDRPDWPAVGDTFPLGQATGVAAEYWDGAAWSALSPAPVVFADGSRTGIAPAPGTAWPALGTVAGGPRVRLVFAAGPTTAADLPVEVEHFVIAHVSLWADENRAAAPQAAQNFPWLYAGLEPLKVY